MSPSHKAGLGVCPKKIRKKKKKKKNRSHLVASGEFYGPNFTHILTMKFRINNDKNMS